MPEPAARLIARCAVADGESLGRVHDEPPQSGGSPFDLDRRRIVSSTAFRRLQYKTQVFVSDAHDHFRTRLTHTVEVAEIARRLASALGVNERLAEAIALAHDLGHPPFGHAGEAALSEAMAGAGGFEHNRHTLRVVDFLEHPYPEFRGLNLSFEVREGIIKHRTIHDRPAAELKADMDLVDLFGGGPQASIEGQIASVADRLAYDCHDLEDALGAGLVGEADLRDLVLWNEAAEHVRSRYPPLSLHAVRRPILDHMLDRLVADVVTETCARLTRVAPESEWVDSRGVQVVRRAGEPVGRFSANLLPRLEEIERLLIDRVYAHPRVRAMDDRGRRMIEGLFAVYVGDTASLPRRYAARVDAQGPCRVACDYIAGMTDRFCRDEYQRLLARGEIA